MSDPTLTVQEKPSVEGFQRFSSPYLIAALAWVGVIFFSSTTLASELCEHAFSFVSDLLFRDLSPSDTSYGIIHLLADKGLHVTLFVIFATLLWRAILNVGRKIPGILLAGLIVGSLSEVLQMFFPGRDPAVRDVLINFGSTALGVWLNHWHAKPHRSPNPVQ